MTRHRLFTGARVSTKLGPGQVAYLQNARDRVTSGGKRLRGVAWVTVELDRGGRRIFAAHEVERVLDE